MARAAIIDYIDIASPDIRIVQGDGRYDYVSDEADGPLAELMWCEVRRAFKSAKLTALEAGVVDAYMRGHKDKAIADGYNKMQKTDRYNRHAIKVIRQQAFKKLRNCPDLGLMTDILETFGLDVTRYIPEKTIVEYRLD